MVPPGSDHVSRQWSYSGARSTGWCAFAYGTIALCGASFHSTSASTQLCNCRRIGHDPDTSPTTPVRQRVSAFTYPVWADPRSLATTRGVSVDFRSSGYLDVSVLPVSSRASMDSTPGSTALPVLGFPIRRSAGQRLFSASPRLIAAVHVLLRLLMPRHPPCALHILTVSPSTLAWSPMGSCYPSLLSMLAIVQFSSFAEDDRRGLPATRSLRTEQRFGKGKPLRDRVRSTFQERRRTTVSVGGLLAPSRDESRAGAV